MILYIQEFLIDGHKHGDVLIYRTKKAAINRFNIIKERASRENEKLEFVDNSDFHDGFGYMLKFSYTPKDGTKRTYRIVRQATED